MANKLRIKDLAKATDYKLLAGKLIEIEDAVADKSYAMPAPVFAQGIADILPASKYATYLTAKTYDSVNANYQAGSATLVTQSQEKELVLWMLAYVQYPRTQYRLVPDVSGQQQAYVDTTFTGSKVAAKWVEVNSAADRAATIPDFNQLSSYKQNDAVKYTVRNRLRVFVAKLDLDKTSFPNQLTPAPTGLAADVNWLELNTVLAANYSRLGEITCKYYYNSERNGGLGDSVEDLISRENAGASILYINRTVTVESAQHAGNYRIVKDTSGNAVFNAYEDGSFTSSVVPATLEKIVAGNTGNVTITEWTAGAQVKNSLVVYSNNLYRVKADITNSQSAPDVNTQFYQLLSTDVTKVYVDAADRDLQLQLNAEDAKFTALTANAVPALDNLEKIGNQILANQQQVSTVIAILNNKVDKNQIEQDLTSNSTSNVASVAAVKAAVAAVSANSSNSSNSSVGVQRIAEYTCAAAGAQSINLTSAVKDIISVIVLEVGGYVRTLYPTDYSTSGLILTIKPDANLLAGDKITGYYLTNTTFVNGNVLEFSFSSGFADDFTLTATASQAGNYSAVTSSNVNNISYTLNSTAVNLPFALALGDTLKVAITRTDATKSAVISIS